MSVLVNTRNEQEEKVLLAFLDSLKYKYQHTMEDNTEQITTAFLDRYNKEIDKANAEIEAGDYVSQEEVEQLFEKRRKLL